ncbi:hypothetical protein NDU88_001508, partial [Pleurodeles waltl]
FFFFFFFFFKSRARKDGQTGMSTHIVISATIPIASTSTNQVPQPLNHAATRSSIPLTSVPSATFPAPSSSFFISSISFLIFPTLVSSSCAPRQVFSFPPSVILF